MSRMALGLLAGLALSAIAAADGTRVAGTAADAFGQPMRGINSAVLAKFNYGLGLFRHERAPIIQSDDTIAGIGPLHNARACVACHIRDGRGAPPDHAAVDGTRSIVFNLVGPAGGDGVYGAQIQDQAAGDLPTEGVPRVTWRAHPVTLADGTTVSLRQPLWHVDQPGYGAIDPATQIDARVAPALVGLGLLQAVDADTILAQADPEDLDGDGISGVASMVGPPDAPVLGRFGWRAGAADLMAQAAKAAHLDMGLSVPGLAQPGGDCTQAQAACRHRAATGRLDLSANDIFLLAFYVAHLDVPDRRNSHDPAVQRGETVFADLGCGKCHLPRLRTGSAAAPEFANRDIAPYTDLLLHDMGPALAGPAGPEWRTTPLWGIGLTRAVSGHNLLLHDGRARGFAEAILWHGGEASAARDGFAGLDAADRAALVSFLQSL